MSDWRDVMQARNDADAHASRAETYAEHDAADALREAVLSVGAEIRALAVLIDFARGAAR